MLLLILVQAAVAQTPLNLTCVGGGTANKTGIATINSNSRLHGTIGVTPFNGSGSGRSTVRTSRQQDFADQVDIRLFSGDDRIRMPRTMLPALRGGQGGWFKLKNVVADARSIRAKAAVNLLNNPNVFIDRVTGNISISGKSGNYSGECQPMAADTPARF